MHSEVTELKKIIVVDYPTSNVKRPNGEAQRWQITFASPPLSCVRPLQRSVMRLVTERPDIFLDDELLVDK